MRWPISIFVISLAAIAYGAASHGAPPHSPAAQPVSHSDDQFINTGMARTKAELAVRKLRQFFDKSDATWRAVNNGIEVGHNKAIAALQKSAGVETKKPDDLRDPTVLETLAQRRADIDEAWSKFATVDRPDLESTYRSANSALQSMQQIYNTITQMDSQWKDAKLNLAPLQADYDAVAQRADSALAEAQQAVAQLHDAENTWDATALAATRPSDKAAK